MTNCKMALAVASRNDPAGLFFTLNSALLAVRGTPLEGNLGMSVWNDSDDPESSKAVRAVCVRMGVACAESKDGLHSNHRGRNEAVRRSPGEMTVLADSHVLFAHGFFSEIEDVLVRRPNVGMVHAPFTCGGQPGPTANCFYNMMKFDKNLHGSFSHRGMGWEEVVPVALAPHAAYGFRTAQWLDFGGYLECCRGNGGGEPFVGLKYWMLGSSAAITPRTGYVHYTAPTFGTYKRSRTQWLRNHAMVAFVLGGWDVGVRYAKRLRCSEDVEAIWSQVRGVHEVLARRTVVKFDDLMGHFKKVGARPFV